MSFPPRTNSSILRLGDDAIMQFIELCRREECLWNSKIPDYRNKDKRQQAIVDIARELNINYFESQHVWLKFRNLRNTYCQELKKIAASGGTYTPKVIWFSKIDSFLRPHILAPCAVTPVKQPSPPPPALETLVVKQEEDSDDDSDDMPLAHSASYNKDSSKDETPAWWPKVGPAFCKQEPQEATLSEDGDLLEPTFNKRRIEEMPNVRNKHRRTVNSCDPDQTVAQFLEPVITERIKEPLNVKTEYRIDSNPEQIVSFNQTESEDGNLLEPTTSKRRCEEPTTVRTKVRRTDCDPEQIVESLNNISMQVQRLRPHTDLFDRFGRYIASLLRSLPRKKGLLLQPQIINLISVSAAFNLADRPLP